MLIYAEIAQSVEHFTRNEGVEGSSPFFSWIQKPQPLWLRFFVRILLGKIWNQMYFFAVIL